MTSEGLGEMFEVDSADKCAGIFIVYCIWDTGVWNVGYHHPDWLVWGITSPRVCVGRPPWWWIHTRGCLSQLPLPQPIDSLCLANQCPHWERLFVADVFLVSIFQPIPINWLATFFTCILIHFLNNSVIFVLEYNVLCRCQCWHCFSSCAKIGTSFL